MDSVAYKLFDFVCHDIQYRSDDGEFWYFPAESLARHAGDCDDSASLLTSLLRSAGYDAYTAVGTYRGLGHAWCVLDGKILETTYTDAHTVPDPQNYRAYVIFNDQRVIEMWPGAMGNLFQVARNEGLKLSMMAEAVNGR